MILQFNSCEIKQPFYLQQKHCLTIVLMLFYSILSFAQGCLFDSVAASKQPIKKLREHLGAAPDMFSLKTLKRCPEVGDQTNCNSCVAWALSYYAFSIKKDSINEPYSPYFICEKTKNCGNGMYIEEGYAILTQYEWSMPRLKDNTPNCNNATSNTNTTQIMEKLYQYDATKIDKAQYASIDTLMSAIQTIISNGKPVILIMRYHPKLRSMELGHGENAMIRPFNELKTATDYHAVCVVGYQHKRMGNDYIEIINSWGNTWGNGGYAKIKREHFDSIIMAVYAFEKKRRT
jgi:Papain family cysteine protease